MLLNIRYCTEKRYLEDNCSKYDPQLQETNRTPQ